MWETLTLKTVVTILLALSLVWLTKIIFEKDRQNLFKALLASTFFIAALVFIQDKNLEKMTLSDLKKQVFPEKIPEYQYHIEKGSGKGIRYTSYVFEEPRPKLSLTLDPRGVYLHISDVSSINRVLDILGLPKVDLGVAELSSVTGSRSDINFYRWENYPGGALVLRRSLCRDLKKLESYNCISSITVEKKD